MAEQNVYQQNGYENRKAYLESLAEDYGVDVEDIIAVANVLGPNEDFDGLVSSLNDFTDR